MTRELEELEAWDPAVTAGDEWEVLRRQGLLASSRTLAGETLSRGQAVEIERVCRAYPHLTDDEFVSTHLEGWLTC